MLRFLLLDTLPNESSTSTWHHLCRQQLLPQNISTDTHLSACYFACHFTSGAQLELPGPAWRLQHEPRHARGAAAAAHPHRVATGQHDAPLQQQRGRHAHGARGLQADDGFIHAACGAGAFWHPRDGGAPGERARGAAAGVLYGRRLSSSDGSAEMYNRTGAWQGCTCKIVVLVLSSQQVQCV